MRRGTALLALLALAVTGVGCSDDDDGAAQEYIDAVSASLLEDEEFPVDEEQADCVAETTVEAFGVDFLEENDVTPEAFAEAEGPQDLDIEVREDQARRAAQAFVECDLPLGEFFAGPDATDEAVDCVEENLDEEALVDGLTAEYLGDAAESEELIASSVADVGEACAELLAG